MTRGMSGSRTRSSAARTLHSPSHSRTPSSGRQQASSSSPPQRPALSYTPWHANRTPPAAVSPSLTPRTPSLAGSSTSPAFARPWDAADKPPAAGATDAVPSPATMSPLARALQAQWRQLQQDILSPSALLLDRSHHTTAEDDVLRVLRSIEKWADMAVEDAMHTVPYLLAFAVAPLPSVTTQVVSLAALRGVLSSLPSVYGATAASAFVEDVFLGEHQALQALSLCALVALEKTEAEAGGGVGEVPATSPPSTSVLKPRGGHRSLLSRGEARTQEDPLGTLLQSPTQTALRDPYSGLAATRASPSNKSAATSLLPLDGAEMQRRVAHISLCLLNDAASLCPAVANALLSSGALLKAALRTLVAFAASAKPHLSHRRAASLRLASDVLCMVRTLLHSEASQQNEAALVLCSYDAPRAVGTFAQSLAYRSYDARGAVHAESAATVAAEAPEELLWSALRVLGSLTRGSPAGLRSCLGEGCATPTFLALVLTVPVAEIREAAALWLAALLETQPAASLTFVDDLLSTPTSAVEPAAPLMGALVEMVRWRGAQLHVYGVSAMLCWRWMLLSHPTRVAALLPQDTSLLATLIELILRVAPSSLILPAEEEEEDQVEDVGSERTPQPSKLPGRLEGPSESLPIRLVALEAVHVLALSFALGSLETRTRLETHVVRGPLSAPTLRRLHNVATYLLSATHPAYYDDFPAMEVKLAEPGLSEGMRRAGATLAPPPPTAAATSSSLSSSPPRACTSVVVRISAGAQWRQLILENIAELTAAAAPASSTALVATHATSATSSAALRSLGEVKRYRRDRSRHLPSSAATAAAAVVGMTRDGAQLNSAHASAMLSSAAVAPIRVLGATSPGRCRAVPLQSGAAMEESEKEGEYRVDIASIIAASLSDGQGNAAGGGDVAGGSSAPSSIHDTVLSHAPRTVREATLLPTSLSTTALRFRVVQQAENLGGLFVQDSMRTVLQLAQHYTSSTSTSAASAVTGVSAKLVRVVRADRRAAQVRGSAKVRHIDASLLEAPGPQPQQQRGRPPSAAFGSAPRFSTSPRKERNPFAPATKATPLSRAWTVQELRREDVLLFLVRYTHLMTELPEVIAAVEDHLYFLRRQLQLCPTRDVRRRCVLNDLYMNVYPTMHLFLRFVDQQARRSRGVLQMLSSLNGGTLHSGNVLEVYDAVGQCTGLSVQL